MFYCEYKVEWAHSASNDFGPILEIKVFGSGLKEIADFYHSLFRNMSKRTSEELPNAIETLNPNNLEGGDDEEEVFEGSELDSAADDAPAVGGDDFMHTDDFRRLFVGFVMVDT